MEKPAKGCFVGHGLCRSDILMEERAFGEMGEPPPHEAPVGLGIPKTVLSSNAHRSMAAVPPIPITTDHHRKSAIATPYP
jgi:hypothetical protein